MRDEMQGPSTICIYVNG